MTASHSFSEIAVALRVSTSRLEIDITHTRRMCAKIGLSDMGSELAVEQFVRDVALVDQAATLLKDMAPFEAEVRALIARKRAGKAWLERVLETATASLALF